MKHATICGIAGSALIIGVQVGKLLQRRSKPGDAARELPCPDSSVEQIPNSAGSNQEAQLIDGKEVAAEVRAEVKAAAEDLQKEYGVKPGLAVILVGERKDSQSYVRMKKKAAAEANFHSVDITLPDTVSQADLLTEVRKLNADPAVHAILVQLPLPSHIDEPLVLKEIKVEKDADGFAAMNIGNLCLRGGDPPLAIPCTPAGCVELLQRRNVEVKGKNAVVLGRSNIVGMPVAALLQSMDATVTVCHSRTKDMEAHVRRADILIAAIGKPEFVRGSWLKPGCIVIDVGINAIDDPSKKLGHRLVGDVNFAEAKAVASMITPVPGGVGPMTIAMLLKNTLNLARHNLGLARLPLRKTSVVPPKPAAPSLPTEQDYAIVVSGGAGGDIWSGAVKASALREKVQSAANCSTLPAVVLEAPGAKSAAPIVLVGINADGSRSKVYASGASFEEAKKNIRGS